jgi:hypothetical protein
MPELWMTDFPWPGSPPVGPGAEIGAWRSTEGLSGRIYLAADISPGPSWVRLQALQSLAGASSGEEPAFHYVVETDVASGHEDDFNAWYAEEHLPGLARVPGTVRAARYRRSSGSPIYLACYDLVSPATLERAEWLAVRHTDWSSRIRLLFRNTRRTMYRRP